MRNFKWNSICWVACLIHTGTLESFVWCTQVRLKALSDSQVRLKALSDSHRYSWNLCLIHTGTLESFKGPKFSGYHCMMTKPLDTKIQKYTINTYKSLNSRFEAKEPVKSFVGMFRKMKISLYDNWRTAVWFWWIILTY